MASATQLAGAGLECGHIFQGVTCQGVVGTQPGRDERTQRTVRGAGRLATSRLCDVRQVSHGLRAASGLSHGPAGRVSDGHAVGPPWGVLTN